MSSSNPDDVGVEVVAGDSHAKETFSPLKAGIYWKWRSSRMRRNYWFMYQKWTVVLKGTSMFSRSRR
jgi:hypothetical protein